MATYESIIKIKGAVGDLVFYNLNGKNVVRKKSGFNKTAFKKSPTYEKVRQNSSEFGHCSKIGKVIRQALDKYIKEAEDPLLYQKFTKVMTEIKDLDFISAKGKRTVKNGIITEKGNLLLKNFQFGEKPNLGKEISITLKDQNISLNKTSSLDKLEITSIKVDFENYASESFEQKISLPERQEVIFEKHFSDDNMILYFVVLKRHEEIINMGFI